MERPVWNPCHLTNNDALMVVQDRAYATWTKFKAAPASICCASLSTSEPVWAIPASALDEQSQWEEPSERWQDAARAFTLACRDILWSDAGRGALDYLRGRGLSNGTIRYAMLGRVSGPRKTLPI